MLQITNNVDLCIQKLVSQCRVRVYSAKAAIIRQGDPARDLYDIIRGSVTVLLEVDHGNELVLSYLNAGDFFGELGLFTENAHRSAQVRTRAESEIAEISYKKLRTLTDIYTELLGRIAQQLAQRLCHTNRKFVELAYMGVHGRIARTLRTLCEQPDAVVHTDGMQIRVSQQELSRLAGCSREMVGRVLKILEGEKRITMAGKNIVVASVRVNRLL